MKKVIFEKIRLRNFLSYGTEPTELVFQNGINFITGFNKDDNSYNGVGKTSLIVESLSFVLFGSTYRTMTHKEIKNDDARNDCIVECWYTVNGVRYAIMRSISPDILTRTIIHDDGREEDKTKTKPETTKDIINDLGITKEVFTNTIVMTSKESSSFLSQDKSLKTKFIEGILGLEVFSKLAKDAKDEYTAKNTEWGKEEARLQELIKSIERDQVYADSHEDRRAKLLKDHDELLNQLKAIHPIDLSTELVQIARDIELKKAAIVNIQGKQQRASTRKTELSIELRNERNKLKSLVDKPANCPTCKRPFDNHQEHNFEEERKQIEISIADYEDKLSKLEGVIKILDSNHLITNNEVAALVNKNIKTQEDQDRYHKSQDRILSITKERANIRTSTNPFAEKIEQDKELLNKKRELVDNLKEEMIVLEGLKITFSPTGVKAYITSKILDVVNERLNFYLKRLNTPCSISFDEFFEETVINKAGKEISYDRLSDGEKGRVCFSMLFTFRDIRRLQSNVTVNISVFDELFDSSIDINATEEIMELLKTMSEQNEEAYYIITHNPSNVMVVDSNIIHLEKKNGITTIL